jgi:hypothetical protein
MALFKSVFVLGCVVALFGFGTAAEPEKGVPKDPMKTIADRLYFGAEFELTLTAGDTGEKFQWKGKATVFDELVLNNCFAVEGKGGLTATVKFTKTGQEFALRSVGPAEDIYAIQTYRREKTFPKHLKKLTDGAKDTADVKVGQADPSKNAKAIDPIPPYLLPVFAAAAVKYEEKRPELMLRVKKDSVLFFPPAGRGHWSMHRDGDRLFVTTTCSDRMYYATFRVEFRKKAGGGDGEWEYVRTHGLEAFKGE